MVRIETVQQVITNHLTGSTLATQSIGNEPQVFFQGLLAVDHFHKLDDLAQQILIEILVITNGQNIICIGNDGLVFRGIPLTTGIAEAFHIQRVSAENAADGIGDQALDLPLQFCLADSNIPVFYLGSQFVLQTVNFNKDPVQFFFICFQLVKAGITLRFPFYKFICNQSSHN